MRSTWNDLEGLGCKLSVVLCHHLSISSLFSKIINSGLRHKQSHFCPNIYMSSHPRGLFLLPSHYRHQRKHAQTLRPFSCVSFHRSVPPPMQLHVVLLFMVRPAELQHFSPWSEKDILNWLEGWEIPRPRASEITFSTYVREGTQCFEKGMHSNLNMMVLTITDTEI